MEKREIPRKMRPSENGVARIPGRLHDRRDHFPAAWLYFTERARGGVSLARRACIHGGSPFSSLGTPPKQCRVNLVLIRVRDSKRVDNIRESAKERGGERENSREVLPLRARGSLREREMKVSQFRVVRRRPEVFQSCLDCAVIFPSLLSLLSLAFLLFASLPPRARPISRSRSHIRVNRPVKRCRYAELPSNWVAMLLESHVCELF